ncbi:MAG: hypothetical protein SF051_06605 [Elusimicrobiota bacterium]|nr:hypothetical protein [Elusimicrobiota bacterium]
MTALDTPKKKALAGGAALLVAGIIWAAGPPILILPFFYPYLLGHLPWPLVLCLLGAAGVAGFYAWRHRARHLAVRAAGGCLVLFAALAVFGRACQSSKERWLAWHAGGAGLRTGLSRAEVDAALSARARLDAPCVPGGCSYRPRGLAALAFTVMEAYGVDTEYGPDGRLVAWKAWSD